MPQIILSAQGIAETSPDQALRNAGFTVVQAAAGDILPLASEKRPTLILLPLPLPLADSFDLCRRLKADPRTAAIPVLHFSHGDFYPQSLDSGADGYVPADVPPESLAAVIRALIRSSASARLQVEPALRESEKIYRAIGESIDYGVWICTPDGRNTYVSDSFLRLVGLTQEQFSGLEWRDALRPDDVEPTLAAWQECVRTQGRWDMEHRVRGADGTWHDILSRGAPVRDERGEVLCFAGINLDISRLKRVEESLRESERRVYARVAELEAIMDAAPAAIFIAHDPGCRHISGNRMAYNLLRAQPGANLSKSGPDDTRLDHCRFVRDGLEIQPAHLPVQVAASTGQAVRNCEIEAVFEDGASLNLLGDAVPMLDENGRSRGAVGVLLDITERERAHQRLRQAQKLESLGLLAGGLAHDFNNLLVGVIGNASLAHGMLPPLHPVADLLTRIIKAGEQAAALTRQMLAYAGKGGSAVEPVNLSEVASEVTELVQPSIPNKVTLHFHLDPAIPPIPADRGQLHQVFMNLLLNAAEAIGNDAGSIQVKTGILEIDELYIRGIPNLTGADLHPGAYVYLEMRDTGCGMDEETMAKIFDPFFSTKFTGRGLGLAAVSGILRKHHAAIRVGSRPGEGSVFTVLFPAAQPRPEPSAALAPLVPSISGNGTTILLVDDEELIRQMGTRALEQCGYKVLVAQSGLAAINLFKRHPGGISLVILDLTMPGMSGAETLPELRKIRPGVNVIVSSGYSEDVTLASLQGQSVNGFLQKPYTATRLLEHVAEALAAKSTG